jgi:hypothetical protein
MPLSASIPEGVVEPFGYMTIHVVWLPPDGVPLGGTLYVWSNFVAVAVDLMTATAFPVASETT